jgi:DNA polymerase-3 subunit beta
MVMPKDNDHTAVFDMADMRRAVHRMSLIADDRNRSIRLNIREGEIEITAQAAEQGEGTEVVQAEYSGDEVQLGFNWQYLMDFLANVSSTEMIASEAMDDGETVKETDGDKVRVRESAPPVKIAFEFKDPNAQTQMSIAGETGYDYKYIVMPLRI